MAVTPTAPVLASALADTPSGRVRHPRLDYGPALRAELGRGRTLDLRSLPVGYHALGAAVLDTGQGAAFAQWMIERTSGGEFILHRGSQ